MPSRRCENAKEKLALAENKTKTAGQSAVFLIQFAISVKNYVIKENQGHHSADDDK